jgi:hypothetical protein
MKKSNFTNPETQTQPKYVPSPEKLDAAIQWMRSLEKQQLAGLTLEQQNRLDNLIGLKKQIEETNNAADQMKAIRI